MAMTVFHKSGGPGFSISIADLCRILYEFLDEESYADGLVEIFDQLVSREERWLVAFENEQLLWH
jgi:hypothetical protein